MAKRLQAGARTKYLPCAIVSNQHLNNEMEVKAGLNSMHMKFAENIQTNLLRSAQGYEEMVCTASRERGQLLNAQLNSRTS